jgi:hypothetical protein
MRQLVRSPRLVLSVACVLLAGAGAMLAAERSSSAMADAATAFLASLTPEQRQKAVFPFESDERTHWNFIPTETFPRNGLTVKEMTEAQRGLAHNLMKAGLSQRGYMTATAIMQLEDVLGALEQRERDGGRQAEGFRRDPVRYFFSVFGTPSKKQTWGWRVEGHHVSLHFTAANGTLVASSPSFFGSNPAEVLDGPRKGTRILAAEEDSARALLMALDSSQRTQAVINGVAPNEIVTTTKLPITPLSPVGIEASAMTAPQRELLMKVIDVYAGFMADDLAADRLARLKKAGLEKIALRSGPERPERGKKHYYRIQGADVPDRVRQHPEQREPHPLGVARLHQRLRPRPAPRAHRVRRPSIARVDSDPALSRFARHCAPGSGESREPTMDRGSPIQEPVAG